MRTTATRHAHDTTPARVLLMACERSEKTWQPGFTTGPGQKPRERAVAARELARLRQEIAQAKRRCGLPDTAPVVSCYEAGRDGFWLHRFLQAPGVTNSVVDSSSLEVNRRKRRAKSEALDVRKLVRMLMRYHHGAREVGRVVHVPSADAKDQRHLHRDLETLKQERASTTTHIKGLLRSQGVKLTSLTKYGVEGRRPCCLAAVGFRPALPKPDKHLSAHPAIPLDSCLFLVCMSRRVFLGDISGTGLLPCSAVRYQT
jgi:hypothetical protein